MTSLHTQIDQALIAAADSKTQAKLARLVPGAKTIGVPVPRLRALAAEFRRRHADFTLAQACDLMDGLCRERWREKILFGVFLLGRYGKGVAAVPWDRLLPWIDALDNWETCDQLASAVGGAVVAANLGLIAELSALATAENPWKRRFALATVSALNQQGRSHVPETLQLCRLLLADRAPTVRKALAWALKEASKKDETAVYEFLATHRGQLAASVLREASEKLTPAHRNALLLL
jgi:3-methyladenine DNA glycosylase AlkD